MTRHLHPYYEGIIDQLARDEAYRYLDYVKQKPSTVIMDNLVVDVEQLNHYVPCESCGMHKKNRVLCCKDLDLEITPPEEEKIRAIHPHLLKEYPVYRKWYEKQGDFCHYDETFQRLVHKKQDGSCVFWQKAHNGGKCIIHDYAVKHSLEYTDYKPMVCCLYPLMVYVIGEEILLGLIGEESRVVMEMPEKGEFCARKKGPRETHLVIRSEKIMTRMFGKRMYQRIREKVLGRGRGAAAGRRVPSR